MTKLPSIAKFNHLSFPTNDVPATVSFFEKYLGFTASMAVPNKFAILKRPGLDVVIENSANDAPTVLALAGAETRKSAFADCVDKGTDVKWPRAFHIGLEFQTVEDVRTLRDSLKADGFEAETDIFNNDRGSRFFLRAPGGVMVEFNTRSDAAEELRGTFDN